MPANKNQRIRCLILDKCFRNASKNYQIQDLVETVNEELREILPDGGTVSRRTIYNDIAFMESPEGGLVDIMKTKDGVKTFYRYRDPSFSIAGNPFNEEERQYMKTLVETLSQFRGLPQMETLREALANINLLSLEPEESPCLEFEGNPYVEGLQYLQYLHNAIRSKAAQAIEYKPYEKKPRTYHFHPQYLKQYNHRWYVFGVTTEYPDSVSNFPLDRIASINPISDKYIESKVEWDEYFDDVIGVSIPSSEVEEVSFVVHGTTAYYIQSKPLHGSQKSKWIDKDTLEVSLSVRVNYELRHILMGYADSITVLKPKSLRKELADRASKALQMSKE